jgi:hypothetical protein
MMKGTKSEAEKKKDSTKEPLNFKLGQIPELSRTKSSFEIDPLGSIKFLTLEFRFSGADSDFRIVPCETILFKESKNQTK